MAGHDDKNKRDYKKEYKEFHGKPAEKKKRAQRNAARADAVKDGRASKGDGTNVDHKKPLRAGGSNAKSNTRVVSESTNKAWRKGKKGDLK